MSKIRYNIVVASKIYFDVGLIKVKNSYCLLSHGYVYYYNIWTVYTNA